MVVKNKTKEGRTCQTGVEGRLPLCFYSTCSSLGHWTREGWGRGGHVSNATPLGR